MLFLLTTVEIKKLEKRTSVSLYSEELHLKFTNNHDAGKPYTSRGQFEVS